jgi:DNA processing protein
MPYLGPVRIRQLLANFGSALETLDASAADLEGLPGFGEQILQNWEMNKRNEKWRENIELAEQEAISLIPFTSPQYPQKLLEINDPPILLYVKGEIQDDLHPSLAVVGTRNATQYGLNMGEALSQELASCGFTVVSGLARGIDTAAHRAALKQGRTIAVLGSGLSHIYPRENLDLSEEIVNRGALITEYPMRTPPDRSNFPRRNRIVSGMTLGAVLIEAPLKSGAMITMEKSFEYGRKCFALPGRIDHENFKGNHDLLKKGKAIFVENGDDIASHFGRKREKLKAPSIKGFLTPQEEGLLRLMPTHPSHVDELFLLTKIPIAQLNALITGLLLKRQIKELPGRIYIKSNI